MVGLGPAWYEVSLTYRRNVFHWLKSPIVVTSPPIPFVITGEDKGSPLKHRRALARVSWSAKTRSRQK